MSHKEEKKSTPTWMEHYQLNFWLWAFLRNGKAYLDQSKITTAAFEKIFSEDSFDSHSNARERYEACARELELAKYHFVVTMGTLTRILKRAQRLFPSIQPAYSRARHLMSEGPSLRGMIEHADEYFAGGGYRRDQWERRDSPRPRIVADASSTLYNKDGHWLGGRFNVERAIAEVEAIAEEASKIPAPSESVHGPGMKG